MRKRWLITSGCSQFISGVKRDIPERQSKIRRSGVPVILLGGNTAEEVSETIIISETSLGFGGPLAVNRYRR